MEQTATETQAATQGGFNWIDAIVALILLASGIFALMRGFAKEAFVLISWVAAAWVTLHLFPVLQPWMKQQITSETGANVATGLIIFCGTLVMLLPFSNYVIGKVASIGLTSLDKSLGFVFGVLRGMLVVCLCYLVAEQFFWSSEKDVPKAVKAAKTRPVLEAGAHFIHDLAPERKKKQTADGGGEGDDRQSRIENAQQILQDLATPERDLSRNQPAYDDKDRKNLDQLIEKQLHE